MLVWLLKEFGPFLERLELVTTGDSRVFLTARIALASVTSFVVAVLFGPLVINWLKRHFRERIASDSEKLNELHAGKENTPTMGGVFVCAAILLATLLWGNLRNPYCNLAISVVISFCGLGAWDDWIKLSTHRNGLSARHKFAMQVVLAIGFSIGLWVIHKTKSDGLDLVFPIGDWRVPLGAAFIGWVTLVLVGSSNGVNLTDGLDGLAAGCLVFAGSAFTALCYLAGHKQMAEYLVIPHIDGCGEMAVVMAAMVGAMLGFLWFNCHPAQVFMGDAGSLPLGALLGLAAVATRQEALLVVIGGIFVIETLSVILQVSYFKATRTRILACSPLHNHYRFKGHHEIKIVVRFWIVSALLALVALASLKIR